jgi:hypothetical protein
MTSTNPPQERGFQISGRDLKDWVTAWLRKLDDTRTAWRAYRRWGEAAFVRGDWDDEADVTCCVGGRATREIPCRNRNYRGCPFRDRALYYSHGREREFEP